ncbi:MAG: ABC transporter permease [Flavobacterium sp.]|nr:MAG: ABC transporter permease [Flavobacterium sp.]
MFKLNLKIAWRNLWKNKIYTSINVIGLALGLAGFIFILLFVNHEKSYDHWNPELKNIYQVQELYQWAIKEGKKEWDENSDVRVRELLKNAMPQIIDVVSVNESSFEQSILIDNRAPFLKNKIFTASQSFFNVFPYHFVYGDPTTAFNNPGSLVIKESFAKKHFGNRNPLGQIVRIKQQNWTTPEPYTITGVIKEPNTPSVIDFEFVKFNLVQRNVTDRSNSYAVNYVKLKRTQSLASIDSIAQSIYAPFKASLLKRQGLNIKEFLVNGIYPAIRFKPFQELHHEPLMGESWLSLIKPIILLSALLLLISIINFVNMFTAQSVSRAKEVGVKKVIGAPRKTLILQFLSETAMQCVMAMLLSIVIIEGFLPYLNQIFNLSLNLSISKENGFVLLQLFALLVIITLMAGIYPAVFLSSYKPQNVLKGNFGHSEKGKLLRSTLVGIQFVIAVGFLVGIMIISKQVNYLETRDNGFNAKSIIHIDAPFSDRIDNRLKEVNGVIFVGSSNGFISLNKEITGKYKYKNETKEIKTVFVNFEALQALDARIISGRLFASSNIQDSISSIIINESLEKMYGGNMLGQKLYVNDSLTVNVIGIIKDMQTAGFDQLTTPAVYTAAKNNATDYPNKGGGNYIIRFDDQKRKQVINGIEQLWKKLYPEFPIKYTYVQDDLNEKIIAHLRFKKMVEIFSALSISLSLIGLFALAAFLTKQRTKEIAIRKILGADHITLFLLLNRGYFWLMIAANIIAWPLIYIAVDYWLKGFAYRIEITYVPFLVAFALSVLITIVTVSLQVKSAIKENPVDALKYE